MPILGIPGGIGKNWHKLAKLGVGCRPHHLYKNETLKWKGAVYKGRPANGEGGVVLKFRTLPDGGRGVVCESSHFKVKTRNYNRSRFQYESIHI